MITRPDNVIPAEVTLIGVDGNAFSVMGAVRTGLRKAGNPPEVVEAYMREAMSGDYDHCIAVSVAYCEDPS